MRRHRAKKKADKAAQVDPTPVPSPSPTPDTLEAPRAPESPTAGLSPEQLADLVIEWAEKTLIVPSGPLAGQFVRIADFQRKFLIALFTPKLRFLALCIARKNGKSALIAVFLLAYLVGPLHRPDFRALVCSLDGDLAKELRYQIVQFAESSGFDEQLKDNASPTPGRVFKKAKRDNAEVSFLAADKSSGHAAGADFSIIDEGGLLPEKLRPTWNSMISAIGGRDGKFAVISIRGDGPMFDDLLKQADDPATYVQIHEAPKNCALDDEQAWHKANPGLKAGIKSLDYMRDRVRQAKRSPSDAEHFKAHELNLAVNPNASPIVKYQDWEPVVLRRPPELREGPIVLGLDMGGSRSMTALVSLDPWTGRMEAWYAFPNRFGDKEGIAGLIEREDADGVPEKYRQALKFGELTLHGDKVTDVVAFLKFALAQIPLERVLAIGYDRFKKDEVEQVLSAVQLRCHWVKRGQGASATADGSHDVRAFQRLILGETLAFPWEKGITRGLFLMSNAVEVTKLRFDGGGNPALDKSRDRDRIDPVSAAVIAAGLGEIFVPQPKPDDIADNGPSVVVVGNSE